MRHLIYATCHMLHATCHMPHALCHVACVYIHTMHWKAIMIHMYIQMKHALLNFCTHSHTHTCTHRHTQTSSNNRVCLSSPKLLLKWKLESKEASCQRTKRFKLTVQESAQKICRYAVSLTGIIINVLAKDRRLSLTHYIHKLRVVMQIQKSE